MNVNAVVITACLPLLGYWFWYALSVILRFEPNQPNLPPRTRILLLP